MERNTVNKTVRLDLCCGCGICKGICPTGCITWQKKSGLYQPNIDEQRCVNCSLCTSVCPGLSHIYESAENAESTVTGHFVKCYNAWSNDPKLRHIGASGGVVSTIIRELLATGAYDGAFCLDTYDYRNQLKTRLYSVAEVVDGWEQSNAPKSRYLPVSHEKAVAYVKENRKARLIFVGTSCAIRGLKAVVQKLNLDCEQYLFLGLFCDKVFNYNVVSYFEDTYSPTSPLQALHFKNKESGGWPGDMKFYPKDGAPFYIPLSERAKAKAYFMPERCLYCVDKLNACADISLGDNYTGRDESKLGSNSVIIRTPNGANAWAVAKDKLEICDIAIADIQKAQAIEFRLDNMYYGDLKMMQSGDLLNLNLGVPREKKTKPFVGDLKTGLHKLKAGALYDTDPQKLAKRIQKDNKKPSPVIRFIRRVVSYMKRRLE